MPDLEKFGWSDAFARHLGADGDSHPARVVAEHRTMYVVQTALGERSARICGKLRHHVTNPADLPAVGDWVMVQGLEQNPDAMIQRVLPRKSKFSRKAAGDQTAEQVVAANVDTVWIVSSLDQDFSTRRIERYLALAWESGANPVVVLTKADQCDEAQQRLAEVESISIGLGVHLTSSLFRDGLDALDRYLDGNATVALLGSSGVGKSTLINALAGIELVETGDVRRDGKGRHTTTHRQLLALPQGGLIIDTPGMRELQLWDSEAGLAGAFGDIEGIASECRFSDCRHAGEPGCAVAEAVEQGRLGHDRVQSYLKLQRELAHLERKQDVLAQKQETRRIKNIMKSLRDHPKYKR